jgi:hypothetical protein
MSLWSLFLPVACGIGTYGNRNVGDHFIRHIGASREMERREADKRCRCPLCAPGWPPKS